MSTRQILAIIGSPRKGNSYKITQQVEQEMKKFIKKHPLIIVVMLYLILPWDFLPESLLGFLGLTDDALLVFLALLRKYIQYRKKQNKKDGKKA